MLLIRPSNVGILRNDPILPSVCLSVRPSRAAHKSERKLAEPSNVEVEEIFPLARVTQLTVIIIIIIIIKSFTMVPLNRCSGAPHNSFDRMSIRDKIDNI